MKKEKNEIKYVTVGDATLRVEGDLESESNIAVSGIIKGDISGNNNCVLITKDCEVHGNITAGKVTIDGTVIGGINANNTCVRSTGKVNGPINTLVLSVVEGGNINGMCNTEVPKSIE